MINYYLEAAISAEIDQMMVFPKWKFQWYDLLPQHFASMDYVAFQPETSEHMASDADLGLDPSDPLNLLLHNSFGSSDSSMDEVDGSGPQWSQLSSLFPLDHDAFKTSDMLDFGLGMNTIDPHALHNQKVNYDYSSYYPPSDMDHFPFTFQTPESTASNVNSAQDFSDDPAAEIAQRVRQSAGVMQAVPIVHQSLMGTSNFLHRRNQRNLFLYS